MNLKRFFGLSFVFLFSAFAFSAPRGSQELLKVGNSVYDYFAAICLESGRVDFLISAPVTIAEMETYLKEIDYDSLSAAGRKAFVEITDYFAQSDYSINSDIMTFGLTPEFNIEGYYKPDNGIDWVYNRFYKGDLLVVPVTYGFSNFLTMQMEPTVRANRWAKESPKLYSSLPFDFTQFDADWPDYGYISAGYNFTEKTGINFRLGLGQQEIGRSAEGSIIWSRFFTNSTWANLELYSKWLRYNMNVTQVYVDKYIYSHRFDWKIGNKFSFSCLESTMVTKPLELRFLNPLTIYHGLMSVRWDYGGFDSNNCAYLAFTADYTPCRYVRIYGMYAQNQMQTKSEQVLYPLLVIPNSLGGQVGVEAYVPVSNGYVHSWVEGYYATPYLYIKDYANTSLCTTFSEDMEGCGNFYEWIGSPLGPDSIAATVNLAWEVPGKWSVGLSYLFKAGGELSDTKAFKRQSAYGGWSKVKTDEDWCYPHYTGEPGPGNPSWEEAKKNQLRVTPSGDNPEYINRISIKGKYKYNENLSFTVQPSYVAIINHNCNKGEFVQGLEIACGAKVRLMGNKKVQNALDGVFVK